MSGHIVGGAVAAYPHAGGCDGCRTARRCNVCGGGIDRSRRCTNGRCLRCHAMCCTPGGVTSDGHGYGSVEAARAAIAKAVQS